MKTLITNVDNEAVDSTTSPTTDDTMAPEYYQGTFQQILTDNIGNFCTCQFLIGSREIVEQEGVVYNVGVSYFTLFHEKDGTYVVCDIYALKFITFYADQPRR